MDCRQRIQSTLTRKLYNSPRQRCAARCQALTTAKRLHGVGGGLPSHHAASLLAAKPLPRSRRHGNVIGTPEMRPSEALFFRSLHSLSTSARRGGQLAGWHVDSIMAAPAQAQWYTHIHRVLTRRRRRTEKHTDTQAGTHTFSLYPRIHIHSSMFFDAPTAPRSSVLHFGVNIV